MLVSQHCSIQSTHLQSQTHFYQIVYELSFLSMYKILQYVQQFHNCLQLSAFGPKLSTVHFAVACTICNFDMHIMNCIIICTGVCTIRKYKYSPCRVEPCERKAAIFVDNCKMWDLHCDCKLIPYHWRPSCNLLGKQKVQNN